MANKLVVEDSGVTFPSGRTMYAYGGIIGLSPDFGVYSGYDDWYGNLPSIAETPEDRADMVALADHMIAHWTEFRNKLKVEP